MGRGQPPVNNAPLYIVIADQGGDAFTPGVKIPRPATAPVKYFELIPAAGTIGASAVLPVVVACKVGAYILEGMHRL